MHLRSLRAVVEEGSLAAAARRLGYTTSAVSQQIAALERLLNVPLFERGAHDISPTRAGHQMAVYAAEMLSKSVEIQEAIHEFSDGARGRLRLAAFGTASARLLPAVLAPLMAEHPLAELTLEEGEHEDTIPLVEDARIDLAFTYEYRLVPTSRSHALVVEPVLEEQLALLIPRGHRFDRVDAVSIEELAGERWISNAPSTDGHENLRRFCAHAGFVPDVRFVTRDYDVVRGLVRAGIGIALVPALALGIDRAIRMQRIATDIDISRRVHAVHRPQDPNRLLERALAYTRASATEFVEWTSDAFELQPETPLARNVLNE